MGFFKRKQEMNESLLTQLSRIADSLEQSNQNTTDDANQALVTQLNRIAEVIEQGNLVESDSNNHELVTQLSNVVNALERNYQGMPDEIKKAQLIQLERIATALEKNLPKETKLSEQDKKKAAYALNLCLVSISQIIDYSDLYILEQEYEGILNNLNLEHMPKDESLLDILRQILDTITFFRIQEGDKQFIEKEYQDRMKNAIWSAVPSCSAILACPKPKAMLITLVTQVGTGYMNYRREKAQAGRDKEKAIWELHKAAIDQFNGLRRELFTTAWRLADRYGFNDKWRLTERQITQYNQVLTDLNLNRRLTRLEDLEDKFKAYPPFWYFKGHTALMLAESNHEVFTDVRTIARKSFEEYFKINTLDNELLRTDPICAACALEYVSLMGDDEKENKITYIDRAIESAGTHFDILQMCAVAYLDIGEIGKASDIIRRLVCEGYNESVNAQLLSSLYISEHLKQNGSAQYEMLYRRLSTLTDEKQLFAWPKAGESTEQQYALFVNERRANLLENYAKFLGKYYSQKAEQFCASELNSEDSFVRFAKKLESDINSIPYAALEEGVFAQLMREKDNSILRITRNGKPCDTKAFDDIFKNVFLTSASNIAKAKLTTMEDIAALESSLVKAMNTLFADQTNMHDEQVPLSFNLKDDLYMIEEKTSENFNIIKSKIRSMNLIPAKNKRVELLVSGETEYYRYIRDHGLGELQVVAVINDKTINDCDLLITETGVLVHRGQSVAAKVARCALLAATGSIIAVGAGLLANTAVEFLKDVIPFSAINHHDKKIIKPHYSNKHVDMDQLCDLLDFCKREFANSINEEIRRRILSGGVTQRAVLTGITQRQLSDMDLLARRDLCELQVHNVHTVDSSDHFKITAKINNAPLHIGDIFALIYDDQPSDQYLEIIEIGTNGESQSEPGKVRELIVKCSLDKYSILNESFLQIRSNSHKMCGIDVFKLTPKTNCKECGYPTCMVFSMKVAQGLTALEKCPYFSEEAK